MLRLRDLPELCVPELLAQFGLSFYWAPSGADIPNSYWGTPEAGIAAHGLWASPDTPLHSLLHEASHWVCARRLGRTLTSRDAGSDDAEECGVCYLQVLLADALPSPMSRLRLFADMDAWGYSFREGNAARWFDGDGEDARQWLLAHAIVDRYNNVLVMSGESQSLVGLAASP